MITIIQGDNVTLQVTFTDTNGDVIDLTGGEVFFTVKAGLDDADASALISKDISSFSAPSTGIMQINLTNIETSITAGRYYYDIQLVKTGVVSSSDRGRFIVEKDITNRIS